MVDSVLVRLQNARVKKMPLNIHIQWNAGTACLSECVLQTLACRDLRVGPSKPRLILVSMLFSKRNSAHLVESKSRLPFEKKLLPTGIIILRNYLEIGNALPYRKNGFQELFGSVIPIKSVMDKVAGNFFLHQKEVRAASPQSLATQNQRSELFR